MNTSTKFYLFICCFVMFYAQQSKAKVGEIAVFPAPELVKAGEEKNRSAYAIVDVKGNYQYYYYTYKNNTKEIEDEYFSKKLTIEEKPNKDYYCYHLVFRHWLIGQLFKLEEKHNKLSNAKWWVTSYDYGFKGIKKADMRVVKKYLLPKTKISWVGDNLKYLRMYIAFIKMGKNRTRIYFHMVIDAKYHRNLPEVKKAVASAINKIVEVAKKKKRG